MWGGVQGDAFLLTPLDTGSRYDPATDNWTPVSTAGAPSARAEHTAVWTGTEMVVWGGVDSRGSPVETGGRYDPVADTWAGVSRKGAPEARASHTAVWTGMEMIVWGGAGARGSSLNTGGRYDPAADTWTPVSASGGPAARDRHTAVWTGSEMIVWGGVDTAGSPLNTGGRYDSAFDAWNPVSQMNAPSPRSRHTAVWTGSLMVAWGGIDLDGNPINSGGRYDPTTDTWRPTSTANSSAARQLHTAIWTGSRMVVWGGVDYQFQLGETFSSGGRYDPVADTWSSTSTTNAASARWGHTTVWTGDLMVVWGGSTGPSPYLSPVATGGRYDPETDAWTPMSLGNAPSPRRTHTAVWTGNHMIVWGGYNGFYLDSGGRYDPALDAWTRTSTTNAPPGREWHTAEWTGRLMLVWGGESCAAGGCVAHSTGGRYDPLTDTWAPTSVENAPAGRSVHSSVWTGTHMVVWGGKTPAFLPVGTGGRYDPLTDTWAPISALNAPSPRYGHSAVWTARSMIVWGGWDGDAEVSTGAIYNPSTDSWSGVATTGAPLARYLHAAVWTGRQMVVFGGIYCPYTYSCAARGDGGCYDLATDTWRPVSLTNAPEARANHTAVWTSGQMIVWGGSGVDYLNTGARYDPVTDTWTSTSTRSAPSPRYLHSAVWTGDYMIVWGGYGLQEPNYLNTGGLYCACVTGTYYLDADGDGHGDAAVSVQSCGAPAGYVGNGSDCDDADAGAWAAPSEVLELLFSDASTLLWGEPVAPGATTIVYDLIRSGSRADFVSIATCVAADDPDTSAVDPAVPAPGDAFYYLVRAQNACPSGEGSLGTNSDGEPRSGQSCP